MSPDMAGFGFGFKTDTKEQAENNFRFLSEPWSIALRLLSSRSWR
jgi:hypothetical protein